jgi:hypothetical protein
VLHFSESEAYDRMLAARAARLFPVVLAMLGGGTLHLTAVRLLAPHLDGEDHLALLGGAIGKTTEQIRELLARWFPRADVPGSVRRLPAPSRTRAAHPADTTTGPAAAPLTGACDSTPSTVPLAAPSSDVPSKTQADALGASPQQPETRPAPPAAATPRAAAARRAIVEPLSPEKYLFKFTGDDETAALLREARELLSHSLPDGDIAKIFKRGLVLLVADARRRRHAATDRPRRVSSQEAESAELPWWDPLAASRDIAAEVRRIVWDRDGGQCSFVGIDGRRCEERCFLQYHHLKPWIAGGGRTAANIALRCFAHNQYEAKVYFAPIREAMSRRMMEKGRGQRKN